MGEERKRYPSIAECVAVQPMTAPTKTKFEMVHISDLPEKQQRKIREMDEKTAKAFRAIEEDRRTNGTRYDQWIKLKCPNCDGILAYGVSSWNGHRHLHCDGTCGVSVME